MLLDERRGDTGRDGEDHLVGRHGFGDLLEHRAHVLRLDRDDHEAGALHRIDVRGACADAVPLAELGQPLLVAHRDRQLVGCATPS